MTTIVSRLLRVRPVRRRNFLQFCSYADTKSPLLSSDIPISMSEPVKSVFTPLNDFGAYFKGDPKTVNQLQGFTEKLGDLKCIQNHFTTETEKEEEKTLQRLDIAGAIDGHTHNDPNAKLDGDKANVDVCCKCLTLFALSKVWMLPQTMNMDETAISIVKAIDEQPDHISKERFILSQKLMSSPTDYALFKAYKGEKRALFLQSLLKRKRSFEILVPIMNIEETAISIVKAMDEQPELTLEERFVLSQKLMSSPAYYAMFKAYEGEERALFLQSLLERKRAFAIPVLVRIKNALAAFIKKF